MVDGLGQRLGASWPGSPDLRPDNLDQPDIRRPPADPLGNAQREPPRIDQGDGMRRGPDDCLCGRISKRDNLPVNLEAFKQTDNR